MKVSLVTSRTNKQSEARVNQVNVLGQPDGIVVEVEKLPRKREHDSVYLFLTVPETLHLIELLTGCVKFIEQDNLKKAGSPHES